MSFSGAQSEAKRELKIVYVSVKALVFYAGYVERNSVGGPEAWSLVASNSRGGGRPQVEIQARAQGRMMPRSV